MAEETTPLVVVDNGNGAPSRTTANSNKEHKKEHLPLKIRLYVYVSHFLSAWGDRMWAFGVGLYMVELEKESLRLVAIFGFASAGAVLFLGAIAGDWVDNTQRLTAARCTLIIQNVAVAVCSVLVFFVFLYHEDVKALWPNEGFAYLCYTVIIIIAIVSNLASVANTIVVERDWVVEICGRDSDLLADMTSKLRSIDLTTMILSPIATGQIVAYTGIRYGALFIAGWNVISVVIAYYFIWKVYDVIPALRRTKNVSRSQDKSKKKGRLNDEKKCKWIRKMFSMFITLKRGWKTYMGYDVAFAGLGLASLYLTVLGFDNITVGFAYSQGISESLLGILMALGALIGIISTFVYPRLKKAIGLQRTGLIGHCAQVLVLTLSVVSVWAPGSPFDMSYLFNSPDVSDSTLVSTTEAYQLSTEASNGGASSLVSIVLLLSGIVGARFGLYMADLSITQLFLESVIEEERGIVNGVQSSLNQLMDMLKFLMVILAPRNETFGLLVLISFGFVFLGLLCFVKYSKSIVCACCK